MNHTAAEMKKICVKSTFKLDCVFGYGFDSALGKCIKVSTQCEKAAGGIFYSLTDCQKKCTTVLGTVIAVLF